MNCTDSLLINPRATRLFFTQIAGVQVCKFNRIAKHVHKLFRNQMQPIAGLQRLPGETTQY